MVLVGEDAWCRYAEPRMDRTPAHALLCFTCLPGGLVPQAHSRTPACHDAEARTPLCTGVPRMAPIAPRDAPGQVQYRGWNAYSCGRRVCTRGHPWRHGWAGAACLGVPASPKRACASGGGAHRYGAWLRRSARRRAYHAVGRRTHPGAYAGRSAPQTASGTPIACAPRATSRWAHRRPLMPFLPVRHTAASSRAGRPPWRRSGRVQVPCVRSQYQHNARASAGSCSAPLAGRPLTSKRLPNITIRGRG